MPASSATPATGTLVRRLAYYAVPVIAVLLLALAYALSPSFYLEHVLAEERREGQLVEIVTVAGALPAALLLGFSALRLWRERRERETRGAAVIVALIGGAAFFFAGEELSWGQEIFHWSTPEELQAHTPRTNLHNVDTLPIRVQTLASLFLVAMFFVLPAAWALDRSSRLPRDWAPAIAEGPVVFCMAVAFLWRESKTIYCLIYPDCHDDRDAHPLYWGFFEQVAEHKEMLVGIGLLLYGAWRLRARGARKGPPPDRPR